jgi:pimeloyl-ACP methyl ester carboxylesterase
VLPLVPDGAVVVGHSTGAVIAAAVAARAPAIVRALLVTGLPLYPDEVTAREEIARLGLLARLTVQQHPGARLLCGLMCALRPAAMAAAWLLSSNVPRAVAADGVRHTWRSYSRTLEQVLVRHRPDPHLRTSRCPVLLLHGDADAVAPAGHIHAFASAQLSPRSPITCRIVPGDHHLPLRRPDVVNSAIGELLSGTGRS